MTGKYAEAFKICYNTNMPNSKNEKTKRMSQYLAVAS